MVNSRELPESLSGVDLGVIDALKALKEEADILRGRLSGLDSVKADFDPAVFSRVNADYVKQLYAIEAKAEPLRQQARESYARLRGALAEITQAHEAVKLDRQEIELRRKLGEFSEDEYTSRLKAIETALSERAVAHKQGEALRARFLEVFASEEELTHAADPVHVPEPMPAHAPAPGPASTQEMPIAEDIDIPMDIASFDIPAAQTQILQVLKLPEPPKLPPPPGAKPATFGANATMSLRTARLVPQNPEAGRSAIPLPPKPVSLGSDASNEIRIGGPGVEARHARISVDSKGYTLSDLGSKSGTRVNAEAVQERLLHHEDVIQIGMARFVFREG
ncbi:MAG: FHA domain-containing protein [Dokdonella sp.]